MSVSVGGLTSLLMCGYQDIVVFGGISDYGFADKRQSKPSRTRAKKEKRERKKARKNRRKQSVEKKQIDLATLIGKNDDEVEAESVSKADHK